MPLNQDEIKRRIHAARLLRDLSQKDLDRLGREDGFGNGEMGRVERGELEFRPGKHLDPLCRYLRVPRWWFTADELDFGGVDSTVSPDEVGSLLAHQNGLLARQSEILEQIRAEQAALRGLVSVQESAARRMEEAAAQLRSLESPSREPQRERAGSPRRGG